MSLSHRVGRDFQGWLLRSIVLRLIPTIAGLLAFAAMALVYRLDHALYLAILRGIGIRPWSYPFIDGAFMYAMKRCWLAGVDVYRSVPCDVIPGNKMAYSPLWQRLPFLPTGEAARVPVGVVTDLLLILSVALLPPARCPRDALLLAAAVTSTMLCFALERNNIDVWIYLLVIAGGVLFCRASRQRGPAYLLFGLAGLLKYYPFILFGLALSERPRRGFVIAVAVAMAVAVFVICFRGELGEEFANIPHGSPFTDLVGIVNIPIAVSTLVGVELGWRQPAIRLAMLAGHLLLAAIVLAMALRLARRADFAAALAGLAADERIWLVIGCLVMGGCYLIGQNVGYRGVYLLIVLSGLLALTRASSAMPALNAELVAVAMLTVPLMWMEGLRHAAVQAVLALGAGADIRHGVNGVLWGFREVFWLNLERVMLAVVIAWGRGLPAASLGAALIRLPQSAGARRRRS